MRFCIFACVVVSKNVVICINVVILKEMLLIIFFCQHMSKILIIFDGQGTVGRYGLRLRAPGSGLQAPGSWLPHAPGRRDLRVEFSGDVCIVGHASGFITGLVGPSDSNLSTDVVIRLCPGPSEQTTRSEQQALRLYFWESYGLITSYFHFRNSPVLHEMYWIYYSYIQF